ncbi:P-loop NTPase fold protein [Actinoplanes sp. ATCC 53533]|uniref:P-loop NTPase fold protein n=1 Tax=Actinoplanes sp. ATCC 53533 TaxID=1288362 RepID=UPI0013151E86|nr:P-loop NTPase fold protein [Actinoplanes sp. ATCC 53533]
MTTPSPPGPPETDGATWTWMVRIVSEGRVVGCGFFVGDGLIVTAAHVVSGALGIAPLVAEPPTGPVRLQFPHLTGDEEWTAGVVAWFTDDKAKFEDIAVLRLPGDKWSAIPAPRLLPQGPKVHARCRTFGFPQAFQEGLWVTGTFVGPTTRNVWQLDMKGVKPGFSGAPIWDDEAGGVTGMLMAGARDDNVVLMVATARLNEAIAATTASAPATAPPATPPGHGATNDQVRWVADFPATDDALKRRPLARALAQRLRQVQEDAMGRSFLIHLDGEWGSGKSSLLNFVREELDDWLVVDFDAWRESRLGPPWWSLLTSLRAAVRGSLRRPGRVRLRLAEAGTRMRRGGVYLLSLLTMALLMVGLYLLFRPAHFTAGTATDLAKLVAAGVTAVVGLWGASLLTARFFLWESPRGARFYETTDPNPAGGIADHFGWLVRRSPRPVLFLVDDLDRAGPDYVVELIETVQTVIRDAQWSRDRPVQAAHGCHVIVAADGAWLRQSFESRYETFQQSIAEPGRPLGYLFLDKIFQLTLAVPAISTAAGEDYLRELLGVGDLLKSHELDLERAALDERIGSSTSEGEIIEALRTATPVVREAVTSDAIDKLHSREVEAAREHFLQKFSGLLAANPRSIKRFVIANSMARTVLTLQGNFVDAKTLALWLIVQTRWPALARYLQANPGQLDLFTVARAPGAASLPEPLRPLAGDEAVRTVLTHQAGGPLTPALLRDLAGGGRR